MWAGVTLRYAVTVRRNVLPRISPLAPEGSVGVNHGCYGRGESRPTEPEVGQSHSSEGLRRPAVHPPQPLAPGPTGSAATVVDGQSGGRPPTGFSSLGLVELERDGEWQSLGGRRVPPGASPRYGSPSQAPGPKHLRVSPARPSRAAEDLRVGPARLSRAAGGFRVGPTTLSRTAGDLRVGSGRLSRTPKDLRVGSERLPRTAGVLRVSPRRLSRAARGFPMSPRRPTAYADGLIAAAMPETSRAGQPIQEARRPSKAGRSSSSDTSPRARCTRSTTSARMALTPKTG